MSAAMAGGPYRVGIVIDTSIIERQIGRREGPKGPLRKTNVTAVGSEPHCWPAGAVPVAHDGQVPCRVPLPVTCGLWCR